MEHCQVCSKKCRPLRCTRCQSAWYCSQACQKMDWKAGHKNRCRRKGDSWKQRDEEEKHQPQECKVDVQTAQKAMLELQALLKEDHSLESLQAEYYKAQDEIEHLQKNQEQKIKSAVSGKSKQPDLTKDEVSTAYRNAVENRQHGKEKSTDKIKNHSEIETNSAANALTSNPRCNILLQNVNSSDLWDYWIEILSNICCYQIMLRPNAAHLKDMFGVSEVADELELSVTILDERQHTTSVVSLRRRGSRQEAKPNVIFCAMLPGKVSSTPRSFQVENTNIDGSGSLNLRLEYQSSLEQKSGELESSTSYSLSISSAKKLQCRFCQMNLLSSNTPIDRVVPMPSANWDDIADYLICYSGQATMDFTTASTNTAQVGVLLDDTSAVLLHQQDVGDAVCVLAINPYGETEMGSTLTGGPTKSETDSSIAGDTLAENTQQSDKISPFAQAAEVISNDSSAVVRGRRSWRETVGGGSICCSQCCSVLGFASLTSPETYRFLKHRLVVGNASNETTTTTCIDNDAIPLMQCACFVAHEMIRYAETKAVFTFVVERGDSFVAPTKPGHENRTRVLLLKLLSWDSYAASNTDEEDKNVTATKPVQFQKTAKIIYEESWLDDNSVNNSKATTGDDGNEDITQWVWGGADLCCLPGTSSGSLPSASANLAVGKEASKEQPPQTLSSVRLRLEEQEWDELRESLQVGSKYFSKEVIDETILTKLGRREMPPSTKSTLNHPSLIMPLGLSAIRIN